MTQPQPPAGLGGWLVARRPSGNGLAISAILAGAFLLSYTSLYQLALACGYSPMLARVWPILVDGFTAYCSRDAWHAYQQRRTGRVVYDGLVVLAATLASALFQAEAATAAWLLERPPVGLVQAVHVVPAVAALLALEIGMHRRTHPTTAAPRPAAPAAAAASPRPPRPPPPAADPRPRHSAVPAPGTAALPAATRHPDAAAGNGRRPPAAAAARSDGSARARIAALVAEEAAGHRPRVSGAEAAALLGGGVKERWATELLRQERQRLAQRHGHPGGTP
jgi:signal transduction histidine kinase